MRARASERTRERETLTAEVCVFCADCSRQKFAATQRHVRCWRSLFALTALSLLTAAGATMHLNSNREARADESTLVSPNMTKLANSGDFHARDAASGFSFEGVPSPYPLHRHTAVCHLCCTGTQ